jgi:large subunit ribosomal protein L21
MKYAVIAISGTQYLVSENQDYTVDNLNLEEKSKNSTDQVLLTVEDDKVNIGNPLVENATVDFEILKNYKGKKLKIFTYKSKSRFRKTKGFRAQLTDIKILKINNKQIKK